MSDNSARDQALAQVRSIEEMVAALDVDYDRLEELRDERNDFETEEPCTRQETWNAWSAANPEQAEELAKLEAAAGNCNNEDDAREQIQQDALSVEVRSGWQSVGEQLAPAEFRIVLCTGGPHVELQGELDDNDVPDRVRVIYADWGESGELFDFNRDTVLRYCQEFYFETTATA